MSIDTLINDIYNLFSKESGHTVSDENLEVFALNIKAAVKRSLAEAGRLREPELRVSKIGTPDRKLWYEFNMKSVRQVPDPATFIKFIYGHFLEELVLLLCKESGHKVSDEQGQVDILGIKGHKDCRIDGVVVDVKSASKFSFQKFKDGTLLQNDPFGYVAQISGYVKAEGDTTGAFLAINKESGELALLKVGSIDMIDPYSRINHIKQNVLTRSEPPVEKCYKPEPLGQSGNEVLNKNCMFCDFKDICWKDTGLRKFKYSDGVRYFTKVVSVPRVEEII